MRRLLAIALMLGMTYGCTEPNSTPRATSVVGRETQVLCLGDHPYGVRICEFHFENASCYALGRDKLVCFQKEK